MKPCVHGDVCREYMRKFGFVKQGSNVQLCILTTECPRECRFYKPKEKKPGK